MPITFATSTHTGLVRRSNEDSFFARPPVFAVADGMGGAEAGEVASAMAASAFSYFLPQTDRAEEELAGLISRVNSKIFEHAAASGLSGMGTTITAAVVNGRRVVVAHVGDSRAWLWRGGQLQRLTEDHSLVAEMIRKGQLTEAEAATHPQRSVITRALGVDAQVEVDTGAVDYQAGDIFLLASDGLHGLVPEDEIARVLAEGGNLDRSARTLVEAANSRGGSDNVTVILFSPDGSVPSGYSAPQGQAAGFAGAGPGANGAAAGNAAAPVTALAASLPPMMHTTPPAHLRPTRIERFRAWFSSVPGMIVSAIVILAVIIAGGWYATRLAFYVGIEGDKVTMYQGIPYSLGPLPLSSIYRSSPVNYQSMEPYWQDRVIAQSVQSQGSAETMLETIIADDRARKDAEQKLREEADAQNKKLEGAIDQLKNQGTQTQPDPGAQP